jgi:putative zinc finger/helix-turn-helix YgiT family protein
MKPVRGPVRLPVNGEPITVPKVSHLRCPKCGEVLLGLDAARQLFRTAHAIYRRKHCLLAPDEIRALRHGLGLTPAGLARVLHLTKQIVVRWESARAVQSAAVDALLRVVRDVPGSLDYLRSRAA